MLYAVELDSVFEVEVALSRLRAHLHRHHFRYFWFRFFGFSVDFSAVSACGGVTSWMSVVSFECVTLVSGLLSLLLKYFWCIWSICRFQSCSPTVSGLLIRLPVKYFPTEVRTH